MSALRLDERGVLRECPSCGRTNRLPYAALKKTVRCGQCHQALAAPDAPIDVPSAGAFDALVRSSSLPVVVDFWAPWCAPCRMVAPELEKVARSAAGELLVVKVNTEAQPELGDRFGIRSIPTMAIFHRGVEATRASGARPAAEILAFARQAILATPGDRS